MYRNVRGFCDKENKNLDIRIEFIPCGTQEGNEYALGKIDYVAALHVAYRHLLKK